MGICEYKLTHRKGDYSCSSSMRPDETKVTRCEGVVGLQLAIIQQSSQTVLALESGLLMRKYASAQRLSAPCVSLLWEGWNSRAKAAQYS